MTIDVTTAKQMTALHEAKRQVINGHMGINDTKAIFFPIDSVKAFMAGLPPAATGVRIYFGAYPADHANYPNQTTIIAIGTVADGTGKNVDKMQQFATPHDGGDGTGDPANHGSLCPPDSGCDS